MHGSALHMQASKLTMLNHRPALVRNGHLQLNMAMVLHVEGVGGVQHNTMTCTVQILDAACTAQAEDEEEESNELVSQVLDEIGVNLDSELVKAPGQKQAVAVPAAAEPEAIGASAGGADLDDDLQTRLNNLRKQ